MAKQYGDFQGMWIPAEIWWDDSLSLQEKCFLIRIHHLDNGDDGCYANNEYFANFFKISKVRVSEIINKLVKKNMVTSQIIVGEGNKRKLKTVINFPLRPSQRNLYDPRKLSNAHKNRIKSISKNISSLVPDDAATTQTEIPAQPVVVTNPAAPKAKKSETSKGVLEWCFKHDAIYFENAPYLGSMPLKGAALAQMLDGSIPAKPDAQTNQLIIKYPLTRWNVQVYMDYLRPYGIAKYFHTEMSKIWPPETYKDIRETKVVKSIDAARLMLQADKRTPEMIADVMKYMLTEDQFWKNTIRSIDKFREKFDKICSKMDAKDRAEEATEHKPTFKIKGSNE